MRGDTFGGERGGILTRQPVITFVDAATMTTVMSTNRADSGRFSPRAGRSSVHTRAQTLFGYFASD